MSQEQLIAMALANPKAAEAFLKANAKPEPKPKQLSQDELIALALKDPAAAQKLLGAKKKPGPKPKEASLETGPVVTKDGTKPKAASAGDEKKREPNPYMKWRSENFSQIKEKVQKQTGLTGRELMSAASKESGRLWAALPDAKKALYGSTGAKKPQDKKAPVKPKPKQMSEAEMVAKLLAAMEKNHKNKIGA